jgi:hypothetical protein
MPDQDGRTELAPTPGLATALVLLQSEVSPEFVQRTLCAELDLSPSEALAVVTTAMEERRRAARALLT